MTADDRWEGERVARWLSQAGRLERQLAPVNDALLAAAALGSGERVLDVGCGHGPSTRRAAGEVGPNGRVTGIDVAEPMIDAARVIEVSNQAASIDWVVGDVADWTSPYLHDIVLSRFGVMFFDDPEAAFSSLAAATVPGGRLCVAVWARRDEVPLFEVPFRAAAAALDGLRVAYEAPAVDEGPFSLSDQAAVVALLERSGWSAVGWAPHVLPMLAGGGLAPGEAAEAALELGPTRLITPDAPVVRAPVLAAIEEAYCDHVNRDGHVELDGHIVVVTATRA